MWVLIALSASFWPSARACELVFYVCLSVRLLDSVWKEVCQFDPFLDSGHMNNAPDGLNG